MKIIYESIEKFFNENIHYMFFISLIFYQSYLNEFNNNSQ
jgi:hypothetical protein